MHEHDQRLSKPTLPFTLTRKPNFHSRTKNHMRFGVGFAHISHTYKRTSEAYIHTRAHHFPTLDLPYATFLSTLECNARTLTPEPRRSSN